ncbi:MAG: ABC transporter permease [Thermoprotei archaeon]
MMLQTNLITFLIRRSLNAAITIFLLLFVTFTLIHIILPTPEAMAKIYVGDAHYTPSELQSIIVLYGLNKPLYVQFVSYVESIFRGTIMDPIYGAPVMSLVEKFLPITFELVVVVISVEVTIGVLLGGLAALNRGKALDWGIKALYLMAWAAPIFLWATLMQFFFAYDLKILPAMNVANPILVPPKPITGYPLIDAAIEGDWVYFRSVLKHMILPVVTLAMLGFGGTTRLTRSSTLRVMDKDYVKLAYMKGMSNGQVFKGTVLRNSVIPIITMTALHFGYAIGGAVIAEEIFLYKGMGFFMNQAIMNLDLPVVMTTTLLIGISIAIANLVADILYAVVDPRVRVG